MTTNRLSAAVALAFVSSVPFSAFAEAPAVTWRAPLNGATISKTISGSACAVDATSKVGMQRLVFWIGGMQINNDYASPWNCSLDTTRVRDGNYAMRVDAYSAKGELTQRTINVTVKNSGTTTTTPTTPANTAPTVSITSPTAGQSVTGGNLSFAANAIDNAGVSRVEFRLDGSLIATDTSAPYSGSRSGIAAGSHTLTATAFDAAGLSSTSSVNFTVPASSSPTTPPPTGSTALPAPTSGSLDVWFKAPLSGATVSGVLSLDKCYVKGTGVSRVNFSVDGKAIGSDTNVADGMSCTLDTRTLANGTHQLMASAVSSTGTTRNDVISINVQNSGSTTPPPTTTPTPAPTTPPADDEVPPVTSNLPTGGTAVATFHSIGLYFKPSSNPGAAGCKVQYRKVGESAFKPGLALWYDTRNSECRGSLVNLVPGTQYEVQLGNASSFTHKLVATTWKEQFPIAKTVTLPAGTVSQPLAITEGGSASGYVLYVANSAGTTIDVKNAYASNVTVAAPYVIVRGLTMKGAQRDAVDLQKGAHHVVVEANDISGWGRRNYVNSAGWEIGVDMDSAIRARCGSASAVNSAMSNFVIQRNRIHDPRYGANSWDWGHPAGPQGVTLSYCGGNHVIRYNDFRSADSKHYLNDAIGGEDNFTNTGFPNNDSDIYGNSIQGVMDDGIEAEGGNRNVRIWGNYLNQTGTGIASTVVATGPLYIFRNVYNQSRKRYLNALDSDDRGPFFKAGSLNSTTGGGRRYVFHNTALQASASGASNGLGAGLGLAGNTGEALTNTVSRNNIFHIWKGGWPSINQTSGGASNDVNYDLYNGNLDVSGEANGIKGTPVYASGHGPASGAGGNYQLAPTSPGYGKGLRLNNFNDDVAAPDMGAHQSGKPAMKFGIQ